MSTSWCLHPLGGEGAVCHLSKEKELCVGTDSNSDIVLQVELIWGELAR